MNPRLPSLRWQDYVEDTAPDWQERIKNYPWVLRKLISLTRRLTTAYDPEIGGRTLMRCHCGDLLWDDSPHEIISLHRGHQLKVAINGTWWEMVKVRMGWVR